MNDYQAKFVTPEQAVKAVQSGDWVDYGFGAGFPELLDKALAARKGEVKDVKVRGGLVIRPRIEVVEADPEQESFSYYSWHIGDYERKLQKNGLVKFMPVMLRSLPYLYRDKHIRCDVAFVPVSKPDENGYCGLGISNYAWRTIFESARTVIFEINEHYPKLQGVDGSHRVHLSEADYIVEGEHEPLPVRSYRAPSETDIAIAKLVVNEIPDGTVLGSLSVPCATIYMFLFVMQSFRRDKEQDLGQQIKSLMTPLNISTLAMLVMLATGWKFSGAPLQFLSSMANCVVPTSMLIIGCLLSGSPLIDVLKKPILYLITLLRCLVMPLIAAVILRFTGWNRTVCLCIVMVLGCSVATVISIFGVRYDRSPEMASKSVLQSNLLLPVTMPLMMFIAERIL